MSYCLYICRGTNFRDDPAHRINADEWLHYIESDPDLRPTELPGAMPLHSVRMPDTPDSPGCWLTWFGGRIESNYPDDRTIFKMLEIAKHFGAHVRGDDGEFYVREANGVLNTTRDAPGC